MIELEDEMEQMKEEFEEAARKLAADKDTDILRLREELETMKEKRKEMDFFLEQKSLMERQLSSLEV